MFPLSKEQLLCAQLKHPLPKLENGNCNGTVNCNWDQGPVEAPKLEKSCLQESKSYLQLKHLLLPKLGKV